MATVTRKAGFVVENDVIRLTASLRGGGPSRLLERLEHDAKRIDGEQLRIDLSEQSELDSLGAALLAELGVRMHLTGKEIFFIGASPAVERGLDRYFYPAPEIRLPHDETTRLEALGGGIVGMWESLGDLLIVTSETLYWSVIAIWRSDGHRRGSVTAQALAIGVGALPVVALISFLIGLILALQSAEQLRQFGANIFVANLLAISMAREMGPLMTAILLAGRSGAAIAAEVATMKVSEEIDALQTMGLNPIRYVIVPKLWGITLTAPLITIMSVVIGISGGLIVAVTVLDLSPQSFITQVIGALTMKDLLTGVVKSLVFAWIIVILASFNGLRVKGGAEGVGRATTTSVVSSIFAVIVADSILGLLFYL